jgi:hypothetical protein
MGFSKKTAFSVSEGDPFCHECSLWLEAYLELIRESNHCIYIENRHDLFQCMSFEFRLFNPAESRIISACREDGLVKNLIGRLLMLA